MFGLDPTFTLLLLLCIAFALFFEFINGFHDTANAVATVIYTNSLKPTIAVIWSGIWNAIGVLGLLTVGEKVGVANKIISLLPPSVLISNDTYVCISIVLSILFTAIIWNLGTWYFGIPCSSSHTLIGSILGAGIGFSLTHGLSITEGIKWGEAGKIGLSLLISPMVGFSLTIIIMYVFKRLVTNKKFFDEVKGDSKPDFFTRLTLIGTCTAVSYSHGSNDGQKGMGLMMLILIGFAPSYFAINGNINKLEIQTSIAEYRALSPELSKASETNIIANAIHKKVSTDMNKLDSILSATNANSTIPIESRLVARNTIVSINENIDDFQDIESNHLNRETKNKIKKINKSIDKLTGNVPFWVKLAISLALGLGTMIGWKRIVVTVGEKIGKSHLTYAQGVSAELVAATTIQAATALSLPVSTTHVLSSGIAGSMVASSGIKNLQAKTIKSIALAWVLTFPVCVTLAGVLFYIFNLLTK